MCVSSALCATMIVPDPASFMRIKSAFFVGSCRVIEPARYLRAAVGKPVTASRHRFHNLFQVEQAVRMASGEPVFDQFSIHLMSERSCADSFKSADGPEHVLADYARRTKGWADHDVFVIEISSMKDHYASVDGRQISVSTHAARDLDRHSGLLEERIADGRCVNIRASDIQVCGINEPAALGTMHRIKELLDWRPVVWVGHINLVEPVGSLRKVYEARKSLSEMLSKGANELGDLFYDPTEVVRELGRRNALANEGDDLFHPTQAGIEFLAGRIWTHCAEAFQSSRRDGPAARLHD